MLILLFFFALFRHLHAAPLPARDGMSITYIFPVSCIVPRAGVVFATRSTSDIIISCFATISACTWTVIHPNIPSPADSRWNIFKRRLVTTIYALLVPEFITVWAYSSILEQKGLSRSIIQSLQTVCDRRLTSRKKIAHRTRVQGGTRTATIMVPEALGWLQEIFFL